MPSDPSHDPTALLNGWGVTNYLANWNVWAAASATGTATYGSWASGKHGYYSPAQHFATITDGMTNTVLYAEGYASCDGLTRVALLSANTHNFGITPALNNVTITEGGGFIAPGFYHYPYGLPNTFMFQTRPLTKTADQMR